MRNRKIGYPILEIILLILFSIIVSLLLSFLQLVGFFIILTFFLFITIFQGDKLNSYLTRLNREMLFSLSLLFIFIAVIFGFRLLVNNDNIRFYLLLEGTLLIILSFILLILRVFQYLNQYIFFQLIYSSEKSMIFRVVFAYSLILTLSPFVFLFNSGDPLILEIKTILILNLFFLIFLVAILPIVGFIRIKLRSISKDLMYQDLIKAIYSFIIPILILIINIFIVINLNPHFPEETIPGLENQYFLGVWEVIICSIPVFVLTFFSIFGPSSLKMLDQLAMEDVPELPKKYLPVVIFSLIYLVLSFFLVSDIQIWTIINIILLESLYIWLTMYIFEKSPEKSSFLPILHLITATMAMTILLIAGYNFYVDFQYETVFIIFIPLYFLLFNYLLTNKLFIDFDFNKFLKKGIHFEASSIDKNFAAKIVLIESLDFIPGEEKFKSSLEVVEIIKGSDVDRIIPRIESKLTEFKNRYQKGSIDNGEWSVNQKLELLLSYLKIIVYYYELDLPLKHTLSHEFLIMVTALKSEDFIPLGVLLHTFFEGYITSVRKLLGIELQLDEGDHGTIKKSGVLVVEHLGLQIKKEIKDLNHYRNKYTHRDIARLKTYSPEKHYKNITRVLDCMLIILEEMHHKITT